MFRLVLSAPGNRFLGGPDLLLRAHLLSQLAYRNQPDQPTAVHDRQTAYLLKAHAFQRLVGILVGSHGRHVWCHDILDMDRSRVAAFSNDPHGDVAVGNDAHQLAITRDSDGAAVFRAASYPLPREGWSGGQRTLGRST